METSEAFAGRLHYLWTKRRLWGGGASLVFGLFATFIFLLNPSYRVEVSLFPKQSGGGVGVLSAIGMNPFANVMASRLELALTSEDLAIRTVRDGELLPELFPGQWDQASKRWKTDPPPSLREGAEELLKKVEVSVNSKGYVDLAVEAGDPEIATRILSTHLRSLNSRMHEYSQQELDRNLAFLDDRLIKSDDPQLRERISQLKVGLIESSLYTGAQAFDLTDTPLPPLRPIAPRRGVLLIVAAIFSILSIAASILALRTIKGMVSSWRFSEVP